MWLSFYIARNFALGKQRQRHVVQAIEFTETDMSRFSYSCKTERENGISRLISTTA